MRWLGLRASQIKRLDSEFSIGLCGESLTARDNAVVASLRKTVDRSNLDESFMEEIGEMERLGKHELQWLYGHPEGLSYLSKTFLPMAILRGDFL